MKNLKHIIREEMDGLEWMDDIVPTPPRKNGDIKVGDVIYVGDEDDPRYIMNVLETGEIEDGTLTQISNKYNTDIDGDIYVRNETSYIVYELTFVKSPNDDEVEGDFTIMGTKYARDLIVKRGYWKYMTKID